MDNYRLKNIWRVGGYTRSTGNQLYMQPKHRQPALQAAKAQATSYIGSQSTGNQLYTQLKHRQPVTQPNMIFEFFVNNGRMGKSTSTQFTKLIPQVQHSIVFTDAACVQPYSAKYNTAWCSPTLLVSNCSAPSHKFLHKLHAFFHGCRWLLLIRPYWRGLGVISHLQSIGKRDNDVQARFSVLIGVCFVFKKCSNTFRNLLCGWIIWT